MDRDLKITIGLVSSLLAVMLALACVKAHYEAKAFNKFSDEPATMMDALLLQLRVQADN